MTIRVDLGEVQGNVVRPYGTAFCWTKYVFLKATKFTADTRHVVALWLAKTTYGDPARNLDVGSTSCDANPRTERDVPDDELAFVNIAFTFSGLCALELPKHVLATFPEDFRAGAKKRAPKLGDQWSTRTDTIPLHDAHLMLTVHSRSARGARKMWQELDAINSRMRHPFETVHCLDAGILPKGIERDRFGFADGRSQPAIEAVDIDAVGDGVYAGAHPRGPALRRQASLMLEDFGLRPLSRSWRLIRTGELLLGYENEDGDLPGGSDAPLGPNSTFMVYREMDQNVDGFREYVKKWAARVGLSQGELRAKIVGRWQNGTPAIRRRIDPGDVAADRRRANDFLYGEDPNGYGCPLGAHARRANPRDALPGGAEQTMRHRIIRRGMPYRHVTDAYGSDRQGLAFICFNASVENGFEFIQRFWINDGEAFGLGSQRDFLLQHWDQSGAGTKMVIQGFRPAILDAPDEPFVKVRGCEYLFVPSRSACTWLAATLRQQ
jgi:deferrochelatase/peroxidase EfeB